MIERLHVRLTPAEQYQLEDDSATPRKLREKIIRARSRRAELSVVKIRVDKHELDYLHGRMGRYWSGE